MDNFIAGWIMAGHPDDKVSDARDQASAPLRVLVADDYPDCAESLAAVLTAAGCETQIAHDGEEALARASAWEPHVCVLDVGMPKLDGYQLARQIREQLWARTCVLAAVTGWVAEGHRQAAHEAGFDCYLAKPVEPTKLLEAIQGVHARRSRASR